MTMSAPQARPVADDIATWLEGSALDLDHSASGAGDVLPRLADAGLFAIGVPWQWGGAGGDIIGAVRAITEVSEESLTAGFVFWGQRTFIEYLLQSPNAALREQLLPDLLSGRRAGATGLSNAMKFLAGIEELQVRASHADGGRLRIDGKLPWVTNLPVSGFDVAAAIKGADGEPDFVGVLSSEDLGVARSADLDLMAMRGSNTAAIKIDHALIGRDRILHANAGEWLPVVRPAFLAMQCAMAIGLARKSLHVAQTKLGDGREVFAGTIDELLRDLSAVQAQLEAGLRDGRFVSQAAQLFRIRIRLSEIATEAVNLELCATGGKAYLTQPGGDIQRRLREMAFIPLITPSISQLKTVLRAQETLVAAQ